MPKITFHILLSLLNHNVNRDEDGRPKTAMLCGTERGRISSQSRRRAMRFSPHFRDCQRSTRTRNAGMRTYRALRDAGVTDPASLVYAAQIVNYALGSSNKKPTLNKAGEALNKIVEKINKAIDKLLVEGELSRENRDAYFQEKLKEEIDDLLRSSVGLVVSTREFATIDRLVAEVALGETKGSAGTDAVKKMASYIEANGLLTHDDRDEDMALFGRMVASNANFNVDAACSISHAITTHVFAAEGDYWSAGEELPDAGDTGAVNTDYAFFGGGVYYQTVVLDLDALSLNLNGDIERVRRAVSALFDGIVFAIPGGKRNSHAADHPAPYVMAVCSNARDGKPESPSVNYLTAFLKPVEAGNRKDGDVLVRSIQRLRDYHADVERAYGFDNLSMSFNAYPDSRNADRPDEVDDLNVLRDFVMGFVNGAS
jgi:CRISPR system Cascade subunit CasC